MSLHAWGDFVFLMGIFIAIFCFTHAAQIWLKRRERRAAGLASAAELDLREYDFAPVPFVNRNVKFRPRSGGALLSARVIDHSNDTVVLQRRNHPNGPVFARRLEPRQPKIIF